MSVEGQRAVCPVKISILAIRCTNCSLPSPLERFIPGKASFARSPDQSGSILNRQGKNCSDEASHMPMVSRDSHHVAFQALDSGYEAQHMVTMLRMSSVFVQFSSPTVDRAIVPLNRDAASEDSNQIEQP